MTLSGSPAGCLGCTFPALPCTCPTLSPAPVGSRAEPSTLDYSVFILNCLLQILIPIFAKYLTLDKLLHLSGPRFLNYKVGMIIVYNITNIQREAETERDREREIQIFVFKSFVLHSLALHPWIRSLWSLNQHPRLSNGDNTFLIWWLQGEVFVIISRTRAGIQEMFPEAEVGAWQYFILYFSHSPKNLPARCICQ